MSDYMYITYIHTYDNTIIGVFLIFRFFHTFPVFVTQLMVQGMIQVVFHFQKSLQKTKNDFDLIIFYVDIHSWKKSLFLRKSILTFYLFFLSVEIKSILDSITNDGNDLENL